MSVEELEILRKKARNSVLIGAGITLLLAILFFVLGVAVLGVMVLAVGAIITFLATASKRKKFKLSFKELFVLKSLKTIFEDVDYQPEMGIDRNVIRNTEMMDMGNRYSSNDYVSAKYKDVNFIQADVHIEEERERRDSDGHTRTDYVTLFKGRWMVFEFNKSFKANIQVRQKGFSNAKVSNWFKPKEEKYKKIALEDEEFNRGFRVFAQNEHEAFYVLTPSLMRRIIELTKNVNGKVLMCFVDEKLHIGLHNQKDSFEHSIFKPIVEEVVIDKISKDIKLITSFIDDLNLDNDLFRKAE